MTSPAHATAARAIGREGGADGPAPGAVAGPPALFSSALLARHVALDVPGGGDVPARTLGPWRVAPPPVAVAVALLEAAEDAARPAAEGHDDAWAAFAQALWRWLPPRLASVLTAAGAGRAETVALALAHLAVGAADRAAYARAAEAVERRARQASWGEVLADYRAAYGVPIQAVLAEPWGVFLEQAQHLGRVRAQRELALAHGVALAWGGKARAWQEAAERAGWAPPPPSPAERAAAQAAALAEIHAAYLQTARNPSA